MFGKIFGRRRNSPRRPTLGQRFGRFFNKVNVLDVTGRKRRAIARANVKIPISNALQSKINNEGLKAHKIKQANQKAAEQKRREDRVYQQNPWLMEIPNVPTGPVGKSQYPKVPPKILRKFTGVGVGGGQLMALRVNPSPSPSLSPTPIKKTPMINNNNWENGNTSWIPQKNNFNNKNTWKALSGNNKSPSPRQPNTPPRGNSIQRQSPSPRGPNTHQRVNTRLQSAISGLQNLKNNVPHGNKMQRVKNWLAGSTANHGWIPGTVIPNKRTRSEINADNLKVAGGRYFL